MAEQASMPIRSQMIAVIIRFRLPVGLPTFGFIETCSAVFYNSPLRPPLWPEVFIDGVRLKLEMHLAGGKWPPARSMPLDLSPYFRSA